MHTYVRYENDRDAAKGLVEWVGFKRARVLYKLAKCCDSEDNFAHWCAYAGVEGRPVSAAWKRWRRA